MISTQTEAPLEAKKAWCDAHCMAAAVFNTPSSEFREFGRFVVADPLVCGGKPTFKGTRIMVWQVLKQVARGMPWDEITAEWRGKVNEEAIAEAIALAERVFQDHAAEYSESLPA